LTSDDDNELLRGLVSDHGRALEKFLARKLDSPEDAAEIAQEAYLRIHKMEEPKALDNARAFLFQVAANLAVDKLRRRTLHNRFLNREKQQEFDDSESGGEPADASPEQIIAARQKLASMQAAIDELPFKVRQAFLMHRHRGLSYPQIADELGVSVSSVEKYILQALKHCRARLKIHYPESDE